METTSTNWSKLRAIATVRAISMLGNELTIFALILREKERGASAVAILFALGTLPLVIFAPWSGYLADRFSTKTLVPIAASIQAALVLSLVFISEFWLIGLIIFLSNSFGAVVPTAWSTLVPRLSTREDLPRVMGMTQSFFSLAMLAGPAIGGFLVSATGYTWPFIIDSLTFILVASAPFAINVNRPGMQKHESNDQGAFDGLRTIFGDPLLRALSILFSLFVLALGVINVGEVFLVIDILGGSPFIYGLIGSIFAIGILIGGLAASAIKVPEFRQASMIISALFLMSISSLLIATAPHWIVIAVFSFTLGFGNAGLQAYASSMIIGRTPEIQRGRVMAGLQALVSIGTLTSFAAAGFLIGIFGVREVLTAGAIIGFAFLVALSPSIIRKSSAEKISADSNRNLNS